MNHSEPRQFKANGYSYRVRHPKRILDENKDELWGEIDYDNRVVALSQDAKEETLLDTRIHEFVHGWFRDATGHQILHENIIERFSTELMGYIWRCGYRHPADDEWGDKE